MDLIPYNEENKEGRASQLCDQRTKDDPDWLTDRVLTVTNTRTGELRTALDDVSTFADFTSYFYVPPYI